MDENGSGDAKAYTATKKHKNHKTDCFVILVLFAAVAVRYGRADEVAGVAGVVAG